MHFEILVEDQSGKKALDILVPKIIGHDHTFRIISYKGIGRLPENLKGNADPSKRILLDQLPRLLKGYGNTYAKDDSVVVIVVCDLDNRCLKAFREELMGVLDRCEPRPETRFCIAIEEGEAWFLGDLAAIKSVYPHAKLNMLRKYQNDSICGTWEKLADVIYPGGSKRLLEQGSVGAEKFKWAEKIAPELNIEKNRSPSFCYFRDKLRALSKGRMR